MNEYDVLKRKNQDLSLLDEEFLTALSEQQHRETYARIASLDVDENPIEQIEGKVTGGSINIDGSSSVRRTCSLTMVTEDVNINDFYWGVNTKFKLEIGLRNKLEGDYAPSKEGKYPEIVWFSQGIFIISTFNTSLSTDSCTISLQGKDKMCMLNGELGGQLFASVDFGTEETETKVVNKATVSLSTSDVLMGRTYYFKPDITKIPDEILSNDNNFLFIVNNETGEYYKSGTKYIKVEFNEDNEMIKGQSNGKRFEVYQLVVSPSQLFENIDELLRSGELTYIKDTFYYEKEKGKGYYIVNNTGQPKKDFIYTEVVNENNETVIQQSETMEIIGNYRLIDLYEVDYSYDIVKIPLEKIIRESVHAYAQEPYHNIIINDLEDYGLEQLTYKGDKTLIALRNYATGHFTNLMFSDTLERIRIRDSAQYCSFEYIDNKLVIVRPGGVRAFIPDPLVSDNTNVRGTIVRFDDLNKEYVIVTPSQAAQHAKECYTLAFFNFGDDLGYRVVDLVYPGDLISSIGDSLTTVLDKIKTMLGDFEYFYDNDGHFVFQKKRTYINTSWSYLTDNGDESYVEYINSDKRKFSFNFEGNRLISAVQNTPVLSNLRNDFIVWGKRKTLTGNEVPIHGRYAIDKKPKEYRAFNGVLYYTEEASYSPSPENEELISGDRDIQLRNFQKNIDIIPEYLRDKTDPTKSDWWELSDWANYYQLLTGAIPQQDILQYRTEPFVGHLVGENFQDIGYFTDLYCIDIDKYTNMPLTKIMGFNSGLDTWDPYHHFDNYYEVDWDESKKDYQGLLSYYQTIPMMITFIYKPGFPEDISLDNGEIYDNSDRRVQQVDWRELIYRMALDYFSGQGCSESNPIYNLNDEVVLTTPDHFLSKVAELNPYYYPTGYTGYEQYYTDMEGFWRQLYNPDYIPEEIYQAGEYEEKIELGQSSIYYKKYKEWSDSALSDYNIKYYFGNIEPINIERYNFLFKQNHNSELSTKELQFYKNLIIKYSKYYIDASSNEDMRKRLYWNVDVFENPESLNFWFEFLDDNSELAQFSIPMVGDRTKVVNEDKASAILFKEIPDVILYDKFAEGTENTELDIDSLRGKLKEETGYTWIYLPKGFSQYLFTSYRNISVKNKIDELLYQYAYCIENISLTAIPVYYLQPNTRIYVQDSTTGINGEYIVSKITLSLSFDGTMSISATKAPERLY